MQFPHAKWCQICTHVHVFFFDTPCHITSCFRCFRSTRSTPLCRMYVQSRRNWRNWSWLNLMNTHLIFMFIFSCRPVGWKDYLYYLSLQLQVCVAKCHPCDFEKRFWLLKSNFLSKDDLSVQTGCWILEEKSPEVQRRRPALFSDIK